MCCGRGGLGDKKKTPSIEGKAWYVSKSLVIHLESHEEEGILLTTPQKGDLMRGKIFFVQRGLEKSLVPYLSPWLKCSHRQKKGEIACRPGNAQKRNKGVFFSHKKDRDNKKEKTSN